MRPPPARRPSLRALASAGAAALALTVSPPPPLLVPANALQVPADADCEALWRTRMALWIKYRRCFRDPKASRLPGAADCHRTRAEALMSMSGPDHARLELYEARAAELGCAQDD